MDRDAISKIFTEVMEERCRQFKQWGDQFNSPAEWLAILVEEVGEVGKEVNENLHEAKTNRPMKNYRKELIQVCAVAVQMIERYDYMQGMKK